MQSSSSTPTTQLTTREKSPTASSRFRQASSSSADTCPNVPGDKPQAPARCWQRASHHTTQPHHTGIYEHDVPSHSLLCLKNDIACVHSTLLTHTLSAVRPASFLRLRTPVHARQDLQPALLPVPGPAGGIYAVMVPFGARQRASPSTSTAVMRQFEAQ